MSDDTLSKIRVILKRSGFAYQDLRESANLYLIVLHMWASLNKYLLLNTKFSSLDYSQSYKKALSCFDKGSRASRELGKISNW